MSDRCPLGYLFFEKFFTTEKLWDGLPVFSEIAGFPEIAEIAHASEINCSQQCKNF